MHGVLLRGLSRAPGTGAVVESSAPPLRPPPKHEVRPESPVVSRTPEPPSPARCAVGSDSYYNCERAYGIFHSSRLALGALRGAAPTVMDGMPLGMTEDHTAVSLAFEAGFLGIPSSFAKTNRHGVEVSTGFRSAPRLDFWFALGTAFTVLNLGHGGPLTLRLGGSFGAGFNFAHGFGYVRGRAAVVIVPNKVDAEVSVQWTPPSASTGHFDEQAQRASVWYRLDGKHRRAIEVYVERFQRVDDTAELERELLDGFGGGVGMSLF